MKPNKDILLIMAVSVLILAVAYIAWCWAAKIIWNVEPPEGTTLTAVAAVGGQLMAGAGIQIVKRYVKTDKVLRGENKELRRQLTLAHRTLERVRIVAGE